MRKQRRYEGWVPSDQELVDDENNLAQVLSDNYLNQDSTETGYNQRGVAVRCGHLNKVATIRTVVAPVTIRHAAMASAR